MLNEYLQARAQEETAKPKISRETMSSPYTEISTQLLQLMIDGRDKRQIAIYMGIPLLTLIYHKDDLLDEIREVFPDRKFKSEKETYSFAIKHGIVGSGGKDGFLKNNHGKNLDKVPDESDIKVLCLIAEGLEYREISKKLNLSKNTIGTTAKRLYTCFGLNSNRYALCAKYFDLTRAIAAQQ